MNSEVTTLIPMRDAYKPCPSLLFILAIVTFSTPLCLKAQFMQQGSKLPGAGGASVAISGDGSTIMIGSASASGGGSVQVYTRSGGAWTKQGARLMGSGATGSPGWGNLFRLSQDGNHRDCFGASKATTTRWARLVDLRPLGWLYGPVLGNKLVGTGAINVPFRALFEGHSAAMSGDGNTAIVGAPGDNGGVGAACRIHARSGGVWSQQSKLAA